MTSIPAPLTSFTQKQSKDQRVSPDGNHLISSSDGTIKVWDIKSGNCHWTFKHGWNLSACISSDGKHIISGPEDRIQIIEGFDDRTITIDRGSSVSTGAIKVWDLTTGCSVHTLKGHYTPVTAVCVSPDGTTIIPGSADGTIKIRDLYLGTCVGTK